MREIVLDTETTGLDPADGHRIVEIGAIELLDFLPTGRVYHQYINPERPVPKEAENIHGLGDQFLRDKPVFAGIASAFLDFIGDAKLVIHNAAFDLRMLNAELTRLNLPTLPPARATDTLAIARRRYPGAQASLDALCRRFGVDNSGRDKHGALLDTELLAEVYLEMMGGRQQDLVLHEGAPANASDDTVNGGNDDHHGTGGAGYRAPERPRALPPRITPEEAAAHEVFIAEFGKKTLWSSST